MTPRPFYGLAALAALLVLSWTLYFAHKPGCWRALVWLADTLLPASCEWPHDGYIAALSWQGRLVADVADCCGMMR